MIARYLRCRVRAIHGMGANLDEPSLRFVRRARWWMGPGGLFLLVVAWSDDRWWGMLFFGFLGLTNLCIAWPMMFTLLRGHEMRDRIDTRGAETFDAVRLSSGVALGCGLVPFVGSLERFWPW